MTKMTQAQRIEALEAQVLALQNSVITLGDTIEKLTAGLLKAMEDKPVRATPRQPTGTYEQRRAAAQRLASRHPTRRSFSSEEIAQEMANA